MTILLYSIVIFHGLIIMPILILAPLVFSFYNKRLKWLESIYMIVAGLALLSFITTKACVLTVWENDLREVITPGSSYSTGFVSHYLGRVGIVFPDIITTIAIGFFMILALSCYLAQKKKK